MGCEEMLNQVITDLKQRKRSLEASRASIEDSRYTDFNQESNMHDYAVGIDVLGRIINIYEYEAPHMILQCLEKQREIKQRDQNKILGIHTEEGLPPFFD